MLAFGLSWVIWVPRAAGAPVGVLGELSTWAVAGAAVLTGGRPALEDLGARLVRWRVSWRWYLLVLLGPAAFSLTSAGAHGAVGGTWSAALPGFAAGNVALLPLVVVMVALTDGLGEELGWRRFAPPRLLDRHTPGVASLLLCLLWATWHLPLTFTAGRVLHGQPFWLLLLDLTAKAIIFGWVFSLDPRQRVDRRASARDEQCLRSVPTVAATGGLTLPLIATSLEWVLAVLVLTRGRPRFLRRMGQPGTTDLGDAPPGPIRSAEPGVIGRLSVRRPAG